MSIRPSRPFFSLTMCCALALPALLAAGAASAQLTPTPEPRPADYAAVQRLQREGQTEQALARADSYIAAHPNDPQMRFLKAGVLSAAGRAAESEELLLTLTRDYPELPEPWNNLAVLYASRGQLDRADEALQTALRVNPAYATALENLGDVRLRQASAAFARARQLDSGNARLAPKLDAIGRALAATTAASAPAR